MRRESGVIIPMYTYIKVVVINIVLIDLAAMYLYLIPIHTAEKNH